MKLLVLASGLTMTTPSISSNSVESYREHQVAQDIDGNRYKTVEIGGQVWLAENLITTRFQDGSDVSTGCIPKDDEANLLLYGRLYNWDDVADERSICPAGWRVASDDDWKALELAIGISPQQVDAEGWRREDDIAITIKKSQPDSLFKTFDQTKVNAYQFNATPAGVKVGNWYITQGVYTEFWTSSSASNKKSYARTLAYSWWNAHKGEIRRAQLNKEYMFSVRCIKI